MLREQLDQNGFCLVPDFLNARERSRYADLVEQLGVRTGDRTLLDHSWAQELATLIRERLWGLSVFEPHAVAVLCTLFNKSPISNWFAAPHRDAVIPQGTRHALPGWRHWSEKQGILHCRAPSSLLSHMLAVRVHLDPSLPGNGALSVYPGSHRAEQQGEPTIVTAPAGAALLMRPLLVHSSPKSKSGRLRRVLHFLYGPRELPKPASWAYAV